MRQPPDRSIDLHLNGAVARCDTVRTFCYISGTRCAPFGHFRCLSKSFLPHSSTGIFRKIDDKFDHLIRYRSFLDNLRSKFVKVPVVLQRFDDAVESDGVKLLEFGDGNSPGLIQLHCSYMNNLMNPDLQSADGGYNSNPDFTDRFYVFRLALLNEAQDAARSSVQTHQQVQ